MSVPEGIRVEKGRVAAITGTDKVSAVHFADGSDLPVAGVFVAYGVAGSADLARKVGLPLAGNAIQVQDDMSTAMPGLFAAGDATGGLLQIAKAVYEGAKAGLSAAIYVQKKK